MPATFTVSFDAAAKAWVVSSSDRQFQPEQFDNADDAERFAADMRSAADERPSRSG